MEIQWLKMTNFGVHQDLELDFRPGINGIVGPNGSGKSTVLEALRFLITAEITTPGNLAENVSWGETSATVTGKFKHGDTVYELTRCLGRSKQPPELKFDGQVVRKADDVEKFLNSMMQTSTEALTNNVFVAQGQIDQILFSTNSERLREIQQTVGLHRCADAEKALTIELGRNQITVGLREQFDGTVTQHEQAVKECALSAIAHAAVQREIDRLIPAERQLVKWLADKQTQQLIDQADKDVQAHVEAHTQANARVEQTARDVHAGTLAVSNLQPAAEQAQKDRLSKQTTQKTRELRQSLLTQRAGLTQSDEIRLNAPTDDGLRSLEQAHQDLVARLALREGQTAGRIPRPRMAKEQELDAQLKVVQDRLTASPKREVQEDERQASTLIKELQHKVQLFGQGKCPTCEQPVHGVHGLDPTEVAAQLELAKATFAQLSTQRVTEFNTAHQADEQLADQLRRQLAKLEQAAHAALVNLTNDVRTETQEAERLLKQAHERRRAWNQLEDRLKTVDQQLAQLGDDSVEVPVSIEELDAQILLYQQAQSRLNEVVGDHRLRQQALGQAQDQLAKAQARRQALHQSGGLPTDEELKAAQADVELLRTKQTELRKLDNETVQNDIRRSQLEGMKTRLEQQLAREAKDAAWAAVCRRARDILHVSGLPSLLMREYAKVLNKRMAYYLDVWEAGFSFILNDDLLFIVTYPNGCTHGAGRLSGGQKIVASTAFRLAMADTFAKQVGLLVLDEPSNYLDKDNIVHLQNLLLKLKDLSGHTGKQIILVTHEEQLVGFFDHHISLFR